MDKQQYSKPYKELIGCPMYLAHSRSDIWYSVNYLSRFHPNPTNEHGIHLKRILKHLEEIKDLGLIFSRNKSSNPVIGYCDSDFAGDVHDRKLTTGYMFKVLGSSVC